MKASTKEKLLYKLRQEMASAGGKARAESLSAKDRSAIAAKASKARWAKARAEPSA